MSMYNGRYSNADVGGHRFSPKRGGLPSELYVYDIQYVKMEPTAEMMARDHLMRPIIFKFVFFTYVWEGQTLNGSLRWYKFLTDYARTDWLEYWNSVRQKPRGV